VVGRLALSQGEANFLVLLTTSKVKTTPRKEAKIKISK
jgi:hypothetical protein